MTSKEPPVLDLESIETLKTVLDIVFRDKVALFGDISQYLDAYGKDHSVQEVFVEIKKNIEMQDEDKKGLDLVLFLYDSSNFDLALVLFCYVVLQDQPPAQDQGQLSQYVLGIPLERASPALRDKLRKLQDLFSHQGILEVVKQVEGYIGGRETYLVLAKVMARPSFDLKKPILDQIDVQPGASNKRIKVEDIEMSIAKWSEVRSGLVTVQQLLALVKVHDDFVALIIKCGYRSPLSIVRTGKQQSMQVIDLQGIPADRAESIYLAAVRAVSHKEGVLVQALVARGLRSELPQTSTKAPIEIQSSIGETKEINWTTEFGLESMGCEECASMTGPAAYFIDLLHTLNSISTSSGDQISTLANDLFERRPDLANLELSCANIKVLIPYIDLVNEVLEAVVWDKRDARNQTGALRIPSFNMDEDDAVYSHVARPMNTNIAVYRDVVRKVVYPLNIFPYNQAVHSTRAYFKALGVSRYEILNKLQSPSSVIDIWLGDATGDKPSEAQATLDYAMAAEILGLQQEDYVILTKQAFFSDRCLPANTSRTYEEWIGYQGVAKYWGFDSSEIMTGAEGLTLITKLLSHSGLNFSELLVLLRTKYLKGSLVIESSKPEFQKPMFTGKLEDMRLRRLNEDGTTADLDEATCDQLQRFVRLRQRLGWSIEELDAVLSTLILGDFRSLTAKKLDDLAAIKQLAAISGYTPTQLQPLWGEIDAHGEHSLFAQLFLKGSIDNQVAELFLFVRYGAMAVPIPPDPSISGHARAISSALGVAEAELLQLLNPKGTVPDLLSLGNISALYRATLLCKIIGISPRSLSAVPLLFPNCDPFASPVNALQMIQDARAPRWDPDPVTMDRLLFWTNGPQGTEEEKRQPKLKIIHSINSIQKKAKLPDNASSGETAWETAIISALKSCFPDANVQVLRFVLDDLVSSSDLRAWIDSLGSQLSTNSFSGYLAPPKTGTYIVEIVDELRKPLELKIDSTKLEFQDNRASTPQLVQGQWYKLESNYHLSFCRWKESSTTGAQLGNFDIDQVVSDDALAKMPEATSSSTTRVSALSNRLALSITELHFWQNKGIFDFKKLSLADIRQLEKYHFLREIFKRNGAKEPLLTLYQWLYLPTKKGDELASRLAQVTGWPVEMCTDFLEAKYPSKSRAMTDWPNIFRNISTLFAMREAITLIVQLNFPGTLLGTLFSVALPSPPWATEAIEFEDAVHLRSAIESRYSTKSQDGTATPFSTASDEIRSRQREALIHTLLQQQYSKTEQIRDVDEMFGHFLIDVQMGPVLQTSRLKQAIATVQLFVQRCMLGKETKVSSDALKTLQENANSMSFFHYRLWEANRKAFLYPENWIDPTLRDNKSEQFQALEAALMQAKLDSQTISSLVRDYVHSTGDIANLQIESYAYQDLTNNEFNLHFFGRTRHAPFVFYYRRMTMHVLDSKPYPHWWPWSRMDVDIPVVLTDVDGKKLTHPGSHIVPAIVDNRVYVFLPEFTARKEASEVPSSENKVTDMKMKDISAAKPKHKWEIRMGSTQLRDGKWTPKVVTPLKVEVTQDQPKDVSGFRFITQPSGNKLEIRIELGNGETDLGGFLMTDHQLVLGPGPANSHYQGATNFGKYEQGGQQIVGSFDASTRNRVCVTDGPDQPRVSYESHPPWSPIYNDTNFPQPEPPTEAGGQAWEYAVQQLRKITELYDNGATIQSVVRQLIELKGRYLDDETAFARAAIQEEINAASELANTSPSQVLSNRASLTLMNTIATEPGLKPIYDCIGSSFKTPFELRNDIFGRLRKDDIFQEISTPSAIYMWELAVHIPSLLIERLIAIQQLDLALTIARLVFDPARSDRDLNLCWSFPPFQDETIRKKTSSGGYSSPIAVHEWLEGKGNVHAAARGHPVAYMKRMVMKYIEAVVALGDNYFRENTLESIPFAIQRYTEASAVYGPRPVEVPRLGKKAVKSYKEITDIEKKVYMELDIPFYSDKHTVTNPITALGFIFTGYFCVAANPSIASLRMLIDDRLHKIRSGMDINGNKQQLPLFEPPIDPGAVVRANAGAGGMSVAGLLAGVQSPMPSYRFRYLLQRAFELAQEVKRFGQQFLSIREKNDAEALSLLRYNHQNSMLVLVKSIKESQKKEVDGAIATLQAARAQQVMRLKFYLALTNDSSKTPNQGEQWQDIVQTVDTPTADQFRASAYEKTEIDKATNAKDKLNQAWAVELTAAVFFALPNLSTEIQPWGVGMSIGYGGSELGQVAATSSSTRQLDSQMISDESQQAGRRAALVRQLQERRLEINMTGHELMKIDQEIEELKARKSTWDDEIQAQEEEIKCTAAEETWLRSKFTNKQLYTLLDNKIGSLYHATYLLASEMTNIAKRALDFEHSLKYPNSTTRLAELAPGLTGYWDDALHGQLAGEALYLDLKRLEMVHLENKPYDFEVTKAVSLRQINSIELLKLRRTGSAQFSLPEVLFDMDYPGHYCRRISSVAVTIPCILGAYTSLNCTLRLNKHSYRISPNATKEDYAKHSETDFHTDNIPIQAIAVSGGVEDTGGYSFHFPDGDKYGPFEGAGAVSTWNIDFPQTFGQFDYNTISDVVLHVRYTSLFNGGLAAVATDCAKDFVGGRATTTETPPHVAIDLKNDYADQWRRIATADGMTLSGLHNRLPYWAQRGTVTIGRVSLFLSQAPTGNPKINVSGADTWTEMSGATNLNNYCERSATFSTAVSLQKNQQWKLKTSETDSELAVLVVYYNVSL